MADNTLISVAERHTEDIVPLYYDMKKANPVQINNAQLYKGLHAAYTGGNIGVISNDISKIWNSGNINDDALKAIKILCMENNFVID